MRSAVRSRDRGLPFVLNDDGRIRIRRRHGEILLREQPHVLLHSPAGLVQAIFDRMADARETLQLRRIEAEEFGISGSFNDHRAAVLIVNSKVVEVLDSKGD